MDKGALMIGSSVAVINRNAQSEYGGEVIFFGLLAALIAIFVLWFFDRRRKKYYKFINKNWRCGLNQVPGDGVVRDGEVILPNKTRI